ncbi:MAG: DUF479 domain-containing protein [Chitinophagaceae bacterium]|nr:DUF479 domain-containing protein [Chitinophagaceae bacterium]MCW5925626.1 DUF479 domain-containing protein [Chitinophagaceae bacterium]
MNYLAHAYLSFNRPDIITGNMISDFVKGRQKFDFPESVQEGIVLHRAIDEFTDKHPVTKAGSNLFRPYYGLYAMSFMDVVYDHFLALDKERFDNDSLWDFSQNIYRILDQRSAGLPERFRLIFPYMKKQNWLFNYQFKEGIHNSLKGLVHRAAYMNNSQPAIDIFEEHYEQFRQYYLSFFPEIEAFAEKTLML